MTASLRSIKFLCSMIAAVLLLSCVGHLPVAFSAHIQFTLIISSFCFRAQLLLLFAIISGLFGFRYYSTLYRAGALSSPLGSYTLNVRVADHLYDEALKQMEAPGLVRKAGQELTCNEGKCYKAAFTVVTTVTFGSLVSFILRTRKLYKSDLYRI
ncbi:hypothetical protein PanWU01x14_232960 [Parasponia andersonii]|uniref:Transmembrane protein n=1 Tax=Parasponia andersonii TaxID=3476 RepID=A0A2P5BJR4_PARAD|nr:hypothetical protein PanWU01x14_232960 [Parasponia andersonii]